MIRLILLFLLCQFFLTGLNADDRKWNRDNRPNPKIVPFDFDYDKHPSKIESKLKAWFKTQIEDNGFKTDELIKALERNFRKYHDRRRDQLHKKHKSNPSNVQKVMGQFERDMDKFETKIMRYARGIEESHEKAMAKARDKAEKKSVDKLRRKFNEAVKAVHDRRKDQTEGDVAAQVRKSLKDQGMSDAEIDRLREKRLKKFNDWREKRRQAAEKRRNRVETDLAGGEDKARVHDRLKSDKPLADSDRPFRNRGELEFLMKKRGYSKDEIRDLLADI